MRDVSTPRRTLGITLWLVLVMLACSAEEDTARTGGTRNADTTTAGGAAGSASVGAGTSASDTAGTGGTEPGADAAGASGAPAGGGAAAGAAGGSAGTGAGQPCNTIGDTRVCCGIGEQACTGDAELPVWGPCMDSGGAPIVECNDCASNEFGPGCDAGVQDPPDAGPPPQDPPDAGPPDAGPPSECGPGMECKPGKVRYCDDLAGEWTMSTCDASGHWGTCVAVPVPPAAVGHGDCSDFDYSPEMCCGPAMLCCQDNPGGPFVDFGSGACAAVSCP